MRRAPTRWRRGLAAVACIAATAAGAGGVDAPSGAGADVTPRSCTPPRLAVSFGTTGLDASHVDAFVVFTNTSAAACTLDGYPTVSYVTRSGATIGNPSQPAAAPHGPVTLGKGQSAHSLLRSSVPGVWPPTQCLATEDFGVRVRPPGAAHSRVLHFPESVCSGAAIRESTTAPVSAGRGPAPSACTDVQLTDRLGQPQGAAGTVYVPIVFTNASLYTCTLRGHPKVSSVRGAAHAQVGPAATDDPGPVRAVWVQPYGGTASASVGVVETGNFTPSACVARSASGLRVIAPRTTKAMVLPYAHTVCTHLASTHVSAVVVGPLG